MADRPTHIEVSLGDPSNVSITAELDYQGAPNTVAAMLPYLPITDIPLHCACSGECIAFVEHPEILPEPVDEASPLAWTSMVSQGDVCLTSQRELIVVYGRRCITRGFRGDLPVIVFARAYDHDQLAAFEAEARKMRKEASPEMTIKVAS
jgi:hypothetical protein